MKFFAVIIKKTQWSKKKRKIPTEIVNGIGVAGGSRITDKFPGENAAALLST